MAKKPAARVSLNTPYKVSRDLIDTLAKVGWWNGIWKPISVGLY